TVSMVLVLFVVSLLSIEFLKLQWMRRQFPPGPTPYPFFGNLLQMNFKIHHEHLQKMAKNHGNIFTLWLSSTPAVVLQGFQAVKEGLTAHAEDVAGRPLSKIFCILTRGNGVMFSNGHLWKQQRRFGLATMRKMGVGKKDQDYRLQEEAAHLVEYLQKTNGKPLDPTTPVVYTVANVIGSMIFGHRFSRDDENFHRLIDSFDTAAAFLNSISFFIYELCPWLAGHFLPSVKKLKSCVDFVNGQLAKELESHKGKRKLDENRDFIDYYLDEIEKTKGDAGATYDEVNLIQTISDLFVAGTETTATTLLWALLYMVIYPDIQGKHIQRDEINCTTAPPQTIMIRLSLRSLWAPAPTLSLGLLQNIGVSSLKMCAFNNDIHRRKIQIGRVIWLQKKVRVCMIERMRRYKTHFQGLIFERRHDRNPLSDCLFHFFPGHRVCMGELLARMELFIVFSTLLQAFTFTLPEGVKEVNTKFVFGSTMKPPPYQLCAIPR
ncbi:CP2J6 protein, partial [Erpornis zantholeuca]|nr:CP2J6 protein [Erpornis zantholeuca]